jgi:creatinine amidohydrolase/Fe(II)-dependent formamide hydrolase-like protein
LRQGAWINAHNGKWAFIPEHADWAKREGNLQSLGMPTSVWESIRDIPNDYGGESRKSILLAVTDAGGIRMRGHGDVVVFEFIVDTKVICLAASQVLSG